MLLAIKGQTEEKKRTEKNNQLVTNDQRNIFSERKKKKQTDISHFLPTQVILFIPIVNPFGHPQ